METTRILEQAKQNIIQGDSAAGEHLLHQVINKNPRNEQAWLLLALLKDDLDKKQDCLKKVLKINPHNKLAQQNLASLQTNSLLSTHQVTESTPHTINNPTKYGVFFGIQAFFLLISIFTGGFNFTVWSMLDSAILVLSIGITGILPVLDDEIIRRFLFYIAIILYILAIMDMSINVLLSGSVGWGQG